MHCWDYNIYTHTIFDSKSSRQITAKLYWNKEKTSDGNLNCQELMKRTTSGK